MLLSQRQAQTDLFEICLSLVAYTQVLIQAWRLWAFRPRAWHSQRGWLARSELFVAHSEVIPTRSEVTLTRGEVVLIRSPGCCALPFVLVPLQQ